MSAVARGNLPNLGRSGLSRTAVREALGCSASELERWSADGRLPPDGVKFYYGVGPLGGSKWGRAWLTETVRYAKGNIDKWRAQDSADVACRWVSEASLYSLVSSRFPDAIFQWSPHWLGRQSVDIYVPSINVAFEYQGEQHYQPVAVFGGEDGFHATRIRDARKRQLLARQGVALIEWWYDKPVTATELELALAIVKGSRDIAKDLNI